MIDIAVLGFGTVGSGVAEMVEKNGPEIEGVLGDELRVKYVLDIRDIPGAVRDINLIVNDPDVKAVCETMGGKEPAFAYTKLALEHGISVCTSNKELVDAHGCELSEIAHRHGCSYLFEASVGGGIPILRALRQSCANEKISSIKGILNGTCNYILTRMNDGDEFNYALREAQAHGYAERNPAADIEGYDTARKIAILASLVSGKKISYEQVLCEGIKDITQRDFIWARLLGMSIKLLGIYDAEGPFVLTAPFLVPSGHVLYSVNGVFNAVLVNGTMVGDLMFYGRGAGKLPTASAVISDVIECVSKAGQNIPNGLIGSAARLGDEKNRNESSFVRVNASEKKKAQNIFGSDIKEFNKLEGEFAFITPPMPAGEFEEKASQLSSFHRLRVLEA